MKRASLKTAAWTVAIFLFNLWVARRLLWIEYLDQMASIEGARIALARWILENWRDLSWFPLWYGGIPFENSYPPLFHAIVAGMAALAGWTVAHAYHIAAALFYAMGPVALFWLVLRVSANRTSAAAAALFYSLVSPASFLAHGGSLRFLRSLLEPSRLGALVRSGEGPHVASLTLLPLALLALIAALDRRSPAWWLLAACAFASVALTNWLGAAELLLMAAAWLLANPASRWWRPWLAAAGAGAGAYALASPWLPPSTVSAFLGSEDLRAGIRAPALAGLALTAAAAAAGLAALFWLFRRLRAPADARFAVLFLGPAFLMTLSAFGSGPQPIAHRLRFQLLMEMGVAVAAGLAAGALLGRFPPWRRWIVIGGVLALGVAPALKLEKFARREIRPVDVTATIEHQEARWLQQNMPGSRVLAPGSIRFFLNAVADVPQFAGGFDPGAINPLFPAVWHQILSGQNAGEREGEVAVLWLKAYGLGAVAVSGPNSREAYRDYRNPRKFEGLLPEVWRDGDDVIYRVPRRSASLAHVVDPSALPARRPAHGLDIEPVVPYVRALEDASLPPARMTWMNHHQAVVETEMRAGQVLSIQISHHPGWRASCGARPLPVRGDALGQLVVGPGCEGHCTVLLDYNRGLEGRLTSLASLGALAAAPAWSLSRIIRRRRKRSASLRAVGP